MFLHQKQVPCGTDPFSVCPQRRAIQIRAFGGGVAGGVEKSARNDGLSLIAPALPEAISISPSPGIICS
jgi:hypothetical protein